MENQIDKLAKMLKLWLAKNDLDSDLHIHTPAQWHKREEPYLNTADLVITTEGGLFHLLNYANGDEMYDNFVELLESFGYYFELGSSWCLGLYLIDEEKKQVIPKTYSEKLRDNRWIKKRELIKQRAEYRCEDCGNDKAPLEVHHTYYLYGYEPWEYPPDSLRCLCRKCHESRDPIEKKNRGMLAHFTQDEVKAINYFLYNGPYWFPKKDLFEFLNCLGQDPVEMRTGLEKLLLSQRQSHD